MGINDFLANHVVDFNTRAKLVFSTVMDADDALMRTCNEKNCPTMNGGPKYEYMWQDGKTGKLVKLPAPDYVMSLIEWIDDMITDEKSSPLWMMSLFQATSKMFAKRSSAVCTGSLSMSTSSTLKDCRKLEPKHTRTHS